MTKYLSHEPMFFGPPRKEFTADMAKQAETMRELIKPYNDSPEAAAYRRAVLGDSPNCSHTRQRFTIALGWHCAECGAKIEE